MIFILDNYWLQKHGNEVIEYEDSFSPKLVGLVEKNDLSLAIADGATESSFASCWAKMLTRDFVRNPFLTLAELKDRARILANKLLLNINQKEMSWYAEEKAKLGAFSTFLGIKFIPYSASSGSWSAIGVGDTCFFQIRDDKLLTSFPILSSDDFNNSPDLISSNMLYNINIWENVKFCNNDWRTGDIFIFATDALSCWFLKKHEAEMKPWQTLLKLPKEINRQLCFSNWVSTCRNLAEIKNDDITLLILRV